MVVKKLKSALEKALSEVGLHVPLDDVHLEHPAVEAHGDYSTNVAMTVFKESGLRNQELGSKNPRELAQAIVDILLASKDLSDIISKIEVAGPGFINFQLSDEALLKESKDIVIKKDQYGRSDFLKNKKYLIEHTSPNTIKTLHVGHVRNNVLGMAMDRILEYCDASVYLDAINNDRGIHVMKANWAYLQYGKKGGHRTEEPTALVDWQERLKEWKLHPEDWRTPDDTNTKGDQFVDHYYVMGSRAEVEFPETKEQMQEMLRAWEAGDKDVRALWKTLADWTFEGFKQTYKRLGSHHDHQWFESDFYKYGKETVQEGLKKGVFKKLPDGAVLSDLEAFKLPNTIILRSDGTSMYHTQDLYLVQLKRKKFPSDLYIWDIGPEQTLYLNQLFAMCEQLGIGKREDYFHLSYGFVYLKGQGKMSSRKGNVVSADWLMNETVTRAKKIINNSETGRGLSEEIKQMVAEVVGIGAIKYGFLKVARTSNIHFDIEESVSLDGDSGPYLQYTFARCKSVMKNLEFRTQNSELKIKNFELNNEELSVLRWIYRFPEVVAAAAKTYSPNLICSFLFELAQRYNTFYHQHSILKAEKEEQKEFRLLLTLAVSTVLQNGLNLLGIQSPEKM